jgi:hypothetical protein
VNSIEDFCHLYQQMRQAQNNYFASKKGHRFPTPESKKLLGISKQLEAELDCMVQNFLTQKQAGDILNEMEAQMFMEGSVEENEHNGGMYLLAYDKDKDENEVVMEICSNCNAEVPKCGRDSFGNNVCCPHCIFNPLGCRCKHGEYGVPEENDWAMILGIDQFDWEDYDEKEISTQERHEEPTHNYDVLLNVTDSKEIGRDFYFWANSFFVDDKFDVFIEKAVIYNDYLKGKNHCISSKTFIEKLKMWCHLFGYKFHQNGDKIGTGRILKNVDNVTKEFIYVSKKGVDND